MRVYVLVEYDASSACTVEGVFATHEAAQARVDAEVTKLGEWVRPFFDIEEHEVIA